jgi:hypothetical protein
MAGHLKENHRPLGELFSELSNGMNRLFRDEIELAKAEMSQKLSHVFKDVAFLIIGGFVGYGAFLLLLTAAVLGLAMVLPLWLSALLIGLAACGVAYSLIQKGISDLKHSGIKPEKTIQTVKEDVKWAKEQI